MVQRFLVSFVILDPLECVRADWVRVLNLLFELLDDREHILQVTNRHIGLVIG